MSDQRLLDGVGVGIAYPFQFSNGGVQLTAQTTVQTPQESVIGQGSVSKVSSLVPNRSEQVRVVKDSISRIITTLTGARFMRGESGSQVFDLLFETNDVSLANLAFAYARLAVGAQDPRAKVIGIEQGDSGDDTIVRVLFPFQMVGSEQTEVVTVDITRGEG